VPEPPDRIASRVHCDARRHVKMNSIYVSVEEAAKLLGKRPETVLRMIRHGELPVAAGIGVHGYDVWRPAVEQQVARLEQPRTDCAGRRETRR
jgi:excisionase family DNA binding protein